VAVDESGMVVSFASGLVTIGLPILNTGGATESADLIFEIRSNVNKLTQATGTGSIDVPVGGTMAVLELNTPIADVPSDEKAGYYIYWNVAVGSESMEGQKALLTRGSLDFIEVYGPGNVYAGSPATYRITLLEPASGVPLSGVAVQLTLDKGGLTLDTVSGVTDSEGRFSGMLNVPSNESGKISLICQVTGAINETMSRALEVMEASSVLLTTDKPLYQPGQTIHIRALALSQPGLMPVADAPAVIEVFDGKKNKVFKEITTSNSYGIANASFILAPELCTGDFTIAANISSIKVERTRKVAYYVLPKFRMDVSTSQDYYCPSESLAGTVHCQYFFGKDVDGGTMDIIAKKGAGDGAETFTTFSGTTNTSGVCAFNIVVPGSFDPAELQAGAACVTLEVTATDTAGQVVEKTVTIPVASGPAVILAAPEGGQVRLGAANILYVAVVDPAARPIDAADIDVKAGSVSLGTGVTDASGYAEIAFTPDITDCIAVGGEIILNLTVEASLPGGAVVTEQVSLNVMGGGSFFVRTDKAIYTVGESMDVTVIAPAGVTSALVEVCLPSQVVDSQSIDLTSSNSANFALTQAFAGDCYVIGTCIGTGGELLKDIRRVHVAATDDLVITVTPDKPEYLPGEAAVIDFDVADRGGSPVQSALGVTMVDEAVYHVNPDLQVGSAERYFNPELTEMETLPASGYSYLDFTQDTPDAAKQNAAKLYFSIFGNPVEAGDAITLAEAMAGYMAAAATSEAAYIIQQMTWRGLTSEDAIEEYGGNCGWDAAKAIDPWGNLYVFTFSSTGTITCTSNGPDEVAGTDDDVVVTGQ
jgi:hypothetical protein